MKNLKVSAKLFVSFGIVIFLALVIGVVGYFGMTSIDRLADEMYQEQLIPIEELGIINVTLQRMRIQVREMVLASMDGNMARVESSFGIIAGYIPYMAEHLDIFRATMQDPAQIRLFEEARSLYENDLTRTVMGIYDASQRQDFPAIAVLMDDCRRISASIERNFDANLQYTRDGATALNAEATAVSDSLLVAIVIVVVVALAISVFLVLYISGIVSKPLAALNSFLTRASVGDISLTPEENATLESFIHDGDEIGQMMGGVGAFIDHMVGVAEALEVVAGGDLSGEVKLLSDEDTMGKSMNHMVENFNAMFSEINSASSQVFSGSKQIADGAQALAQGSTEQAASVQQLSASISEIAEKTKANADMARRSAALAESIMQSAERGSGQMNEMTSAVMDINQASQSISKVIKVIDDIAFQTNILALNAAVEAARAGQHGKGFAVVAEEVRNLAAKSAAAAKDTGGLIADSMKKAELGARIAEETAVSLKEIVSGIHESDRIANEIAHASEEQSAGIVQINTGIDQVAQVVQQNSATAEESAAASEEMSGQSEVLQELIAQFKLRSDGAMFQGLPSAGIHAR